jgi:serine phosphatase RsbU (regulator of sigma subunit)
MSIRRSKIYEKYRKTIRDNTGALYEKFHEKEDLVWETLEKAWVIHRFPKEFESEFQNHYYESTIHNVRIDLFLGILVYGIHSILDFWAFPTTWMMTYLIRLCTVAGFMLPILALSFTRFFKPIMQLFLSLNMLAFGISFVMIDFVSQPNEPGFSKYYAFILLINYSCYTVFHMRFYYATVTGWLIFLIYNFMLFLKLNQPPALDNATSLIIVEVGLIAANTIGMISAYFIEGHRRRDFLQQHIIEQSLAKRNQTLDLLNQELAEASDYVRTILPRPMIKESIRTDWRFMPSTSLGGDAFGYHWLDEDHFSTYLIDVSSHGVGAALLSVSVINTLRAQSLPHTDFKDPGSVLNSLNIAFPGEEHNDMFFTIWYGVYNRNTRELCYASGGHPPALLLKNITQDTYRTIHLRTPNYVIGGMPDIIYQKASHHINKGDILYIFSDGVYEVQKPDGSMWRFKEFSDFMNNIKTEGQSRLDCLHQHAKNIGMLDNFEDDFTIVEVAFG